MGRRNETNISVSDDSATLDVDHGSSIKTNNNDSRVEVNTSYEVRPDVVTTSDLEVIEKEDGRIIFDDIENKNKYWDGSQWISIDSPGEIDDRTNAHSQGYIGLLSPFYFSGDATDTLIDADDVSEWVDVVLTVDTLGVFDNRPTDMQEDSVGYTGTGAIGDPYVFSLEGLDTTSFATFRASITFEPQDDEGQLESRILFERHSGTIPSTDFPIEEVTLSMQQGANIPYSAEPMLSFFVGDSIDTNAPGDAGKVRFQIKSDVEGTLKTRALTLYVNK